MYDAFLHTLPEVYELPSDDEFEIDEATISNDLLKAPEEENLIDISMSERIDISMSERRPSFSSMHRSTSKVPLNDNALVEDIQEMLFNFENNLIVIHNKNFENFNKKLKGFETKLNIFEKKLLRRGGQISPPPGSKPSAFESFSNQTPSIIFSPSVFSEVKEASSNQSPSTTHLKSSSYEKSPSP